MPSAVSETPLDHQQTNLEHIPAHTIFSLYRVATVVITITITITATATAIATATTIIATAAPFTLVSGPVSPLLHGASAHAFLLNRHSTPTQRNVLGQACELAA